MESNTIRVPRRGERVFLNDRVFEVVTVSKASKMVSLRPLKDKNRLLSMICWTTLKYPPTDVSQNALRIVRESTEGK
jgi:hypothetical protein